MESGFTSKAIRPLYFLLGIVFVGLGYLGYILPVMPGTVFLILALWSFKRSSPRLEDWLLNRSPMGPTLRDWENGRSMRRRTKFVAIGMMWASILASIAIVWPRPTAIWLVPLLLAIAIGVSIYIWTRPTTDPS